MRVIKRNGQYENVSFDKITRRLIKLCRSIGGQGALSPIVDPINVSIKVVNGLYEGVKTISLDELAAEVAASLSVQHSDYNKLAGRILISSLHKETFHIFSRTVYDLFHNVNEKTGLPSPLVSPDFYSIVMKHADYFDALIVDDRDFDFDYFAVKTLMRSYLLRIKDCVVERPQYMFMRVAIGIHGDNLEQVKETYTLMSLKYFIHATPTLFNAGTLRPQMSSCFLLQMHDDSIDGIYKTLSDCAKISKSAGGIGLSLHNIRAAGSYIAGTNGISNGIVPMIRNFNATARYVDQGGGKRKGSFALYLEPWHADIFDFLDLKKNTGSEELRARDLFYGLWIPDLFMQRVLDNGMWTLMCPNECPKLDRVFGDEFTALYETYEREGKGKRSIPAHLLWEKIVTAQIETGTPYMLYKDAVNRKSNQKNIGIIQSSNLCTEIVEYTDKNEIAVCNLASLCLPSFIVDGVFDFKALHRITQQITVNLNRIIDINYYPLPECRCSNLKHRPIGIGIQGLADVFCRLRLPFCSDEAKTLNVNIFETIYHAALTASMHEAVKYGPYKTYQESPISQGLFQFDLWERATPNGLWDWEKLRNKIKLHGVRNSLLIAPMPTASTAQIMGNNESFEPFLSNLHNRQVLAGTFILSNKYLLEDLIKLNMWNQDTIDHIVQHNGSVQALNIPENIKALYLTVWEMKMKDLIDMAADRGCFIDQSQSMNLYMENPTLDRVSSMHMYAWRRGLKTGMYYLRTKSATNAVKVTIDPTPSTCQNDDHCLICSS